MAWSLKIWSLMILIFSLFSASHLLLFASCEYCVWIRTFSHQSLRTVTLLCGYHPTQSSFIWYPEAAWICHSVKLIHTFTVSDIYPGCRLFQDELHMLPSVSKHLLFGLTVHPQMTAMLSQRSRWLPLTCSSLWQSSHSLSMLILRPWYSLFTTSFPSDIFFLIWIWNLPGMFYI